MPKNIKRTILLFLSCALLMLSMTACFVMPNQEEKTLKSLLHKSDQNYLLNKDKNGQITDVSLISAFVDIANNNVSVIDVYNAIPAEMKTNLSLHDFTTYLEMLEHSNSHIVAFRRLTSAEKKDYILEITTDVPSLALMAEDSEFYELQYEFNDNSSAHKSIIAVQHDAIGHPYLAEEWVKRTNEISNFAKLYFDAIEQRDVDMLSWLLAQGYVQPVDDQILSIEENKANLLMDYYRMQIKTEATKSVPIAVLPNKISFLQELDTLNSVQENLRTCTFKYRNNQITVSDPYPQTIKNYHLNVYYKDQFLLSWSSNGIRQTYYNFMFDSILGKPRVSQTNLKDKNDETVQFWRITYPQISFLIRGEADFKTKTWAGVIDRLEITNVSKDIALGGPHGQDDAIYYGMNLTDFYRQYPFSPEADYIIQSSAAQGAKTELIVQVDNTMVKNLILTVVNE